MKKSQNKNTESGTQWSAMFGDIIGLKANSDKKGGRDKIRIPWQWALWGALLFFIVGYLLPTDSVWILLVAVAAAVIFYFAKSTETVEEQVLLLTDNRTPAQKEAHRRREATRTQKAASAKRARAKQSEKPAQSAKTAKKENITVTQEASDASAMTKAQPKRKPRRKAPTLTT